MKAYVCPMHPQIQSDTKGTCSLCSMSLVKKEDVDTSHLKKTESYKPLYIIISLIFLVSIVSSLQSNGDSFMRYFMAGFFLVFAGFKLLDIKGFAQGYATYDLLAQKIYAYGYIYPFLELGLGLLYITNYEPFITNVVTFVLMSFSGIGVLIKILKKEKFQCACLGTFLNVPLTKITLIEDFGMAAMAAVSIFTV